MHPSLLVPFCPTFQKNLNVLEMCEALLSTQVQQGISVWQEAKTAPFTCKCSPPKMLFKDVLLCYLFVFLPFLTDHARPFHQHETHIFEGAMRKQCGTFNQV